MGHYPCSLRNVIAGLFCFAALALSQTSWAWGKVGHELLNQSAAQMMSSQTGEFFRINEKSLIRLANVPDKEWKKGWLARWENKTHFFQWNRYSRSRIRDAMPIPLLEAVEILGGDYIRQNGSGVWRVGQIYDLLVNALQAKDWSKAIQYAGVLGHYVGDLSQPMHVSSDYDGQSIKRPGIHSKFETQLVNKQDRGQLLEIVLRQAGAEMNKTLAPRALNTTTAVNVSFVAGKEALAKLPAILEIFSKQTVEEAALLPHMETGLSRGAKALALIWDMAARQAGEPTDFPKEALRYRTPKWISFKLDKDTLEDEAEEDDEDKDFWTGCQGGSA